MLRRSSGSRRQRRQRELDRQTEALPTGFTVSSPGSKRKTYSRYVACANRSPQVLFSTTFGPHYVFCCRKSAWAHHVSLCVASQTAKERYFVILGAVVCVYMLLINVLKLFQNHPTGTFLIRVAESRFGYSLSLMFKGRSKHFMIDQDDNGRYLVVGNDRTFPSLNEVVAFHQRHPVRT